eukprot:scaffold650489_cov41-Prasinocladus_malaysianus.AAC.2
MKFRLTMRKAVSSLQLANSLTKREPRAESRRFYRRWRVPVDSSNERRGVRCEGPSLLAARCVRYGGSQIGEFHPDVIRTTTAATAPTTGTCIVPRSTAIIGAHYHRTALR